MMITKTHRRRTARQLLRGACYRRTATGHYFIVTGDQAYHLIGWQAGAGPFLMTLVNMRTGAADALLLCSEADEAKLLAMQAEAERLHTLIG